MRVDAFLLSTNSLSDRSTAVQPRHTELEFRFENLVEFLQMKRSIDGRQMTRLVCPWNGDLPSAKVSLQCSGRVSTMNIELSHELTMEWIKYAQSVAGSNV